MSSYVVSIDNSVSNNETNKTVENLLGEYTTLLKKYKNNEDYDDRLFVFSFVFIVLSAILVYLTNFTAVVFWPVTILVSILIFYLSIYIDEKEVKRNIDITELKTKLLTALKKEKFILEHNREYTLFPRENLLYYARENRAVYVNGEGNFYAQEILLKYPNIQKIVEIETSYEFLKIHSKYQEIINKLCKEKTSKKTIYRTQ